MVVASRRAAHSWEMAMSVPPLPPGHGVKPDWVERFRKREVALRALERDLPLRPMSYLANLRIFEALFREARALGAFPLRDRLEGIEVDIALAKAIRRVRRPA
jgi:hypothetical protein